MLNPTLRRLREAAGFDRKFVRGEGAWLFDDTGRGFLDGWSQYGANALGHQHPLMMEAARAALGSPAMLQPWPAQHAERLAEKLCALAKLDACIFTTSGAEAVEAALKLVRARGRSIVLAAEGSFHGKTLGALTLTGQSHHREGFGPLADDVIHFPWGSISAVENLFAQHSIAAVFLEPIQGERGVHFAPPEFFSRVRELCTQHGAALVLDEIQTGLGRTGRLFACEVEPDVLLLAKALGGGVFPLGALLCREEFWSDSFALSHSSTFANNDAACRVGLAVLDALPLENTVARGAQLTSRLSRLPARFPKTVKEVRGRGLLFAIELHPREEGFFSSYFTHQGLWAYAVAATLAERGVLLLPALSETPILRVTPPLVIRDEEIDLLCDSIESVFAQVERGHHEIVARAMGATRKKERTRVTLPLPPPRESSPKKWAFLIHYTQPEDLSITDPALARLSDSEKENFLDFAAHMPPGVVLRAPRIGSAEGFVIALPKLPSEMARSGRRAMEKEIAYAVDLAARLGAGVVGLGGYTAPYSRRGMAVVGRGPAITTGNTLTAAMAVAASLRAVSHLEDKTVAVVGARGSVGALCARLFARERPRSLILVGNPASGLGPLEKLAQELPGNVSVGSIDRLIECDLVLSCAAAGRPILGDARLRSDVVICDVARPPDAPPSVRERFTVIDGGLCALPDDRRKPGPAEGSGPGKVNFGPGNLQGLPDGIQLACLSETILLALAGEKRDRGVGDHIWLDEADELMALAAQHGFTLPPLKEAMEARQ